ncbi:unnamed protein product, partial [Citrullus colocynthis]
RTVTVYQRSSRRSHEAPNLRVSLAIDSCDSRSLWFLCNHSMSIFKCLISSRSPIVCVTVGRLPLPLHLKLVRHRCCSGGLAGI